MKKIFRIIQNEKGISLVELVVAVSIFSLVMLAATGIFISAMKAQKAIIAKQNVVENMRYVMEFMAKELRMAQVDNTNSSWTFSKVAGTQLNAGNSPSETILFIISSSNPSGDTIKYSRTDDNSDGYYEIMRENITTGTANQKLSSDEVTITGLSFKMNDWNLTPGPGSAAPLITIFMKAKSKNGAGGEVELQTSISPRTY